MRFYKIKALFKLGMEDLTKNINVLIYIIMPICLAFLYSNMDAMPTGYVFTLCVLLTLAMVPIALMGTIIAEEKEKNTLRTLMLNDVKPSEFLLSKALLCMLFVMVDNVVIYLITGLSMSTFISYQLIALFTGVSVIFFGALIGLLSKNQMSAGLLSTPFMLVFMAPLFSALIERKIINKIISIIPTDAMMKIFENLDKNQMQLSNIAFPIGVIIGWIVLSIILFQIVYKKVGVDN